MVKVKRAIGTTSMCVAVLHPRIGPDVDHGAIRPDPGERQRGRHILLAGNPAAAARAVPLKTRGLARAFDRNAVRFR